MSQIGFALNDIRRLKFKYLRFFLQLLIALLLIGFALSMIYETLSLRVKILALDNASDHYIIRDVTREDQMNARLFDDPDAPAKLYDLYKTLHLQQDAFAFTCYAQAIVLNNREIEDLAAFQSADGTLLFNRLMVDKGFIQTFALDCQTGDFFDLEGLEPGAVPVVLGSHFSDHLELGDWIDDHLVVTGFLEPKSFYMAPGQTREILYLDNAILEPVNISDESDVPALDMAITNTTLLTANEHVLDEIQARSSNLNLYDLEFISYSQQLERITNETLAYAATLLFIICLILFFCLVCMVSALLSFIQERRREFAIHLLCGARTADFVMRITLQACTLIGLADCVVMVLYRDNRSAAALTVLASLLIMVLILFIPIISLIRQPISDLISRGE